MNLKNSNVTSHTNGVYRQARGTTNVSTTYSNVWNNSTNYSGASAGTGCLSSNPLYVERADEPSFDVELSVALPGRRRGRISGRFRT